MTVTERMGNSPCHEKPSTLYYKYCSNICLKVKTQVPIALAQVICAIEVSHALAETGDFFSFLKEHNDLLTKR